MHEIRMHILKLFTFVLETYVLPRVSQSDSPPSRQSVSQTASEADRWVGSLSISQQASQSISLSPALFLTNDLRYYLTV